jgi:DNA-binding GntR family transcriptional regulator
VERVLDPAPLRERANRTLGGRIYEQLRDDIVYLRLEPGRMIYENEIAESLNVSRTPVREAFRALAGEELIEILPQRGTRIRPISERKVNEARFIRKHLETGAFCLAAQMWDTAVAARHESRLRQLLDEQQAAVEREDVVLLLKLDEEFHKTIMSITENRTRLQVVGHMRAHINRLRFLALREFKQLKRVVAEHVRLFDCIRAGDERLTASVLDVHFGKLDVELPRLRERYPHYFED